MIAHPLDFIKFDPVMEVFVGFAVGAIFVVPQPFIIITRGLKMTGCCII